MGHILDLSHSTLELIALYILCTEYWVIFTTFSQTCTMMHEAVNDGIPVRHNVTKAYQALVFLKRIGQVTKIFHGQIMPGIYGSLCGCITKETNCMGMWLSMTNPLLDRSTDISTDTFLKMYMQAIVDFEHLVDSCDPYAQCQFKTLELIRSIYPDHKWGSTRYRINSVEDARQLGKLHLREITALQKLFNKFFKDDPTYKHKLTLILIDFSSIILNNTGILKRTEELVLRARSHDTPHQVKWSEVEFNILPIYWFMLPQSVKSLVLEGYLPYPHDRTHWDAQYWSTLNNLKEIHITGCPEEEHVLQWVNWILTTQWKLCLILHSGKYHRYPRIVFPDEFIKDIEQKLEGMVKFEHREHK